VTIKVGYQCFGSGSVCF
jgi:hypothetical protein